MRSRVLKAADYRSVDIGGLLKPFEPDDAALEAELRRLTNPYIRWEEGKTAAAGDQVTCRLVSDCPRFNKEKVRFVAGSGMFHQELEALAIGMKAGETRKTVLPEGGVALTVTGVMKRIIPELSDEMVEKLGLEGIRTLEEYRTYLLEQQKEKYLAEAVWEPYLYLRKRVLEDTEFVIDKADWLVSVNHRLDRSRVLARQEGMVLEEMTAEQFAGRIPVKSYHELVAMLQNEGWDTLLMHLLGKYYAQTDGFTVTEADYEAYIADYVKAWHTTEEAAREIDPYDRFVFTEYGNHAFEILWQYAKAQF